MNDVIFRFVIFCCLQSASAQKPHGLVSELNIFQYIEFTSLKFHKVNNGGIVASEKLLSLRSPMENRRDVYVYVYVESDFL